MFVIKRSGVREDVSFDKITRRIQNLSDGLNIDPILVSQKVCVGVCKGIHTYELDELAADTAAALISTHFDYGTLAARICVSNLHKSTSYSFMVTCHKLKSKLKPEYLEFVKKHKKRIQNTIDYKRDFNCDYFAAKTVQKSYLLKGDDRKIVERPQHMWMRVACAIHRDDIDLAMETYELLSYNWFIHASPTLFNAGTLFEQLSSCFLGVFQDNIDNMYEMVKESALISKNSGAIAHAATGIRCNGSVIHSSGGTTSGIVPYIKVLEKVALHVDQGGNRREGSFAIYLEPWHGDFPDFLRIRNKNGAEETRAIKMSTGIWIPDLLMERVESNGDWSLFCPTDAVGLMDAVGPAFKVLYEQYEKTIALKTMKARTLWNMMLEAERVDGSYYFMYKDACNLKSNQQNLGTIYGSNLCVSGDTLVLTDQGYLPIKELVGKEINAWNGYEWSKVTPKQTGSEQSLVRVELDDGKYLECTKYHKFYCQNGDEMRAGDLKPGQHLEHGFRPSFDTMTYIKFAVVNSVTPIDGLHDTYCFTEPLRNRALFNGILTGNCAEIVEKTDESEIAVCNLASICLPKFVKDGDIDYEQLGKITRIITVNLNKMQDINYYTSSRTRKSNLRHRPMGIGVQGLADVFILLCIPFDSPRAREINKRIFEHIQFNALKQSCELAKRDGPYETFAGSPASRGLLQPHLWNAIDQTTLDWTSLTADIVKHGLRNSLLTALMPTASTSQICGNTEAFEAIGSNLYVRRTLSGEFTVVNKHLVTQLESMDMWNVEMKNKIIQGRGSIQEIEEIPKHIRDVYRTVWEIPQKSIVDMSADRGIYIDQSQSLNVHMTNATNAKQTSLHFYAWRKGLKTGCYYLRTKAAVNPLAVTVDQTTARAQELAYITESKRGPDCTDEVCIPCGS